LETVMEDLHAAIDGTLKQDASAALVLCLAPAALIFPRPRLAAGCGGKV
jgi:hypothetical protein